MGFRFSWLAIRGKSREEIHKELSITPTGTYEELPESPCTGALLSDGWYLVVENGTYFDDLGKLSKLSVNGQMIVCFVHEGIMVSEAAEWRNGKRIWSVLHNTQKALGHLEARGELPSVYDSIRLRLLAKQAAGDGNVDYIFDIPVEVAQSITGYSHMARVTMVDERGFEFLQTAEPKQSPSWFPRLFRKS